MKNKTTTTTKTLEENTDPEALRPPGLLRPAEITGEDSAQAPPRCLHILGAWLGELKQTPDFSREENVEGPSVNI